MYKYLREDIKKLRPYEVNDKVYDLKLDANEGIDWLDNLNLYPNDKCDELRYKLSKTLDRNPQELLIGNGSSELIEYAMKAYLEANETVVSLSPSFSMYKIYTIINKGRYEDYPLSNMEDLDVDGFIKFIEDRDAKLVILSNPNNPTGSMISKKDIEKIVRSVDAMVILDEAYIEFSNYPHELDTRKYKNLIILRTFSKAMALAGIRLGYMIGHEEIIEYINRIRSPYNVNSLSQAMGIKALENMEDIKANIEIVKSERIRMQNELVEIGYKTFSSQANFIFLSGDETLGEDLANKGILIRSFSGELEGYYRISIGRPEENHILLKAMKEVQNEKIRNN